MNLATPITHKRQPDHTGHFNLAKTDPLYPEVTSKYIHYCNSSSNYAKLFLHSLQEVD